MFFLFNLLFLFSFGFSLILLIFFFVFRKKTDHAKIILIPSIFFLILPFIFLVKVMIYETKMQDQAVGFYQNADLFVDLKKT